MAQNDLTQGSILGNIRKFSLPYMMSYFLQILYGLADLFVIGQYCDVASTTAVSNGAQIMHMFTVVIIGLAMGTTVRIARAIGAGDRENAARTIGNTFTLFTIVAIITTAILLAANKGIVNLIDTPQEAVKGTIDYLRTCFIGIPFIIAYNIIASIFRGLGDSKSPMYFVIVACVVNIALDYIFIGHFKMGATGAALGTTLSQAVSVIVAAIMIKKKSLMSITRQDLRPERRTMAGILKTGVPISLQDGFIQIAFIAITVIAVGFGTVASVILQFIPEYAVRIFTSDSSVITLGGQYLKGYVWDCIFAGIHFCFSGFFTACGYSIISFIHNVISITCARIPLSYLTSIEYPGTLFPMGLASPAGSLLSVIICVTVYIVMRRKGKL